MVFVVCRLVRDCVMAQSVNRQAFLDAIAWSEIGQEMLDDPQTDNGYKVIVGSRPGSLILMDSYADHPRKAIRINPTLYSTAAGRYQLLARYYEPYKKLLNLPDFSPASQDAIALQQIKERRALEDVDAGRFEQAVLKVSNIWASLPSSGYGQHENTMSKLAEAYKAAGGTFA